MEPAQQILTHFINAETGAPFIEPEGFDSCDHIHERTERIAHEALGKTGCPTCQTSYKEVIDLTLLAEHVRRKARLEETASAAIEYVAGIQRSESSTSTHSASSQHSESHSSSEKESPIIPQKMRQRPTQQLPIATAASSSNRGTGDSEFLLTPGSALIQRTQTRSNFRPYVGVQLLAISVLILSLLYLTSSTLYNGMIDQSRTI